MVNQNKQCTLSGVVNFIVNSYPLRKYALLYPDFLPGNVAVGTGDAAKGDAAKGLFVALSATASDYSFDHYSWFVIGWIVKIVEKYI